jgi:hypothetical protein
MTLGAAAATVASKVLAHSSMRAPARTIQHHGMKAVPQHGIQPYLHFIRFPFLLHRDRGKRAPHNAPRSAHGHDTWHVCRVDDRSMKFV